jgi:predicted nucleic acid-binding protein
MRVYFDTAVLLAASVAGHPHHSQSILALESVKEKRLEGYVSGYGLSEVNAVLTRTPFSPAIYPAEAWQLLHANIQPSFEIVTITLQMYCETIRECAEN